MGDVEAVGSLGDREGSTRPLAPLKQPVDLVDAIAVHRHSVLDDPTVAVSITHKETVAILADGHSCGFTEMAVIGAGDKSLSQGE